MGKLAPGSILGVRRRHTGGQGGVEGVLGGLAALEQLCGLREVLRSPLRRIPCGHLAGGFGGKGKSLIEIKTRHMRKQGGGQVRGGVRARPLSSK